MSTEPVKIRERTREDHTYTRFIEFSGVEPILLESGHSYGGRLFLPDYATATWNHGSEPGKITVSGCVLKKDGTPGQVRTSVKYSCYWEEPPVTHMWSYPPAPRWLLDLFGNTTAKEATA